MTVNSRSFLFWSGNRKFVHSGHAISCLLGNQLIIHFLLNGTMFTHTMHNSLKPEQVGWSPTWAWMGTTGYHHTPLGDVLGLLLCQKLDWIFMWHWLAFKMRNFGCALQQDAKPRCSYIERDTHKDKKNPESSCLLPLCSRVYCCDAYR